MSRKIMLGILLACFACGAPLIAITKNPCNLRPTHPIVLPTDTLREENTERESVVEIFANGVKVETSLLENGYSIDISGVGRLLTQIIDPTLILISRYNLLGELVYQSTWHIHDQGIDATMIEGLGSMCYRFQDPFYICSSPYTEEKLFFDHKKIVSATYSGLTDEEILDNAQGADSLPDCYHGEDAAYDERGRLVFANNIFYRWNSNDQLLTVESNQQKVTFEYDQFDRRIAKNIINPKFSSRETYVYADRTELASFNEAGELKWLRVPGPMLHSPLCRPVAVETSSAIYGCILDWRCNTIALIDVKTGIAIDTHPRDLWGGDLNKTIFPWAFCGYRYDKEIDLVYCGRRYYSPTFRRWISPDPSEPVYDNLYRYCNNDPLHSIEIDIRKPL